MSRNPIAFRAGEAPVDAPSSASRRRLVAGAAGALALASTGARAQVPAGKPLRLVVPFAAGSSTDAVTRTIAPSLGERLGATILVENRPGANGIIAAEFVAKAAPDGQTFLVGSASVNGANPSLYKSLPFDPHKDLVPIVRVSVNPFLLVVSSGLPFKDVAALIDHSKQNPEKLSYGTPNSLSMVAMEGFKRATGAKFAAVQYKSSPQMMADLAANTIQLAFSDPATAMPMISAGKIRVLAVSTLRRSPLAPEAPAISEMVPNFEIAGWAGFFAPRGTAQQTIVQISNAAAAALGSRELQAKLAGLGVDSSSPIEYAEFARYVPAEIEKWRTLIRGAGIEPQ